MLMLFLSLSNKFQISWENHFKNVFIHIDARQLEKMFTIAESENVGEGFWRKSLRRKCWGMLVACTCGISQFTVEQGRYL